MTREPVSAPLVHRLENWSNATRGAHDPADAVRVTHAWRTLTPRYRDMLRMVYLWHASREVICRRLGIPRRPAQRFELELAAARAALARALDSEAEDRASGAPHEDSDG